MGVAGFFIGGVIGAAISDSSGITMIFALIGMFLGMKIVPKNFDPEDDEPEIHNQTYTDNRKVSNKKIYHITTSNPEDAERIIARLEESDDEIIEIDGDEIIERQIPNSKRSQRFLPKSK